MVESYACSAKNVCVILCVYLHLISFFAINHIMNTLKAGQYELSHALPVESFFNKCPT